MGRLPVPKYKRHGRNPMMGTRSAHRAPVRPKETTVKLMNGQNAPGQGINRNKMGLVLVALAMGFCMVNTGCQSPDVPIQSSPDLATTPPADMATTPADMKCPEGQEWFEGRCEPSVRRDMSTNDMTPAGDMGACPMGKTNCNGACIDIVVDPDHCGGCNKKCSGNNMGSVDCLAGVCSGSCAPGFADCNNNKLTDGCETTVSGGDVANCGSCGKKCSNNNGVPACNAGKCAIACALGFADCNNDPADGCEVDLNTDAANCSKCGMACSGNNIAAPTCNAGLCDGACDQGFGNCNNDKQKDGCEADLNADGSNCSACAMACPMGQVCGAGACKFNCAQGEVVCKGGCVNTQTNAQHCGGCNNACQARFANATGLCAVGVCALDNCNNGFANCNGNDGDGCETNTVNDVANCGACNNACPPKPNAPAACLNGGCGIGQCNNGFADCNANIADGCEVDVLTDVNNCGACNKLAKTFPNAAPACTNGQRDLGQCLQGFANCNNLTLDGCEINVAVDPLNCGACGNVVQAPANSSPACQNGQPAYVCLQGWGDCNNDPADGCEVDLLNDAAHCGKCNKAAPTFPNAGPACQNGLPALGKCSTGWDNCNKVTNDGCEANLNTSVDHCGTCNTPAASLPHAAAKCTNGQPGLGSCDAGYGNCNNVDQDGCEVDLMNTEKHCGACNQQVAPLGNATSVCKGGKAAIGSCNIGFDNCDNVDANGCEVNTQNNDANCGGCGMACNLQAGQKCGFSQCLNTFCHDQNRGKLVDVGACNNGACNQGDLCENGRCMHNDGTGTCANFSSGVSDGKGGTWSCSSPNIWQDMVGKGVPACQGVGTCSQIQPSAVTCCYGKAGYLDPKSPDYLQCVGNSWTKLGPFGP